MGLFGRNKKEENKKPLQESVSAEAGSVYRDGVFEVYESEDRYYAKILNYHGSPRVYEIKEAEFALWKDAGENFGKYSISYERDEDFYIEKAHIELALQEKTQPEDKGQPEEQTQTQGHILSQQDKEIYKTLIDFYNNAVRQPDYGEQALKGASLDECFCCAALSERKISEFVKKARAEQAGQQKISVKLPTALGKFSEFAKRELFLRIAQSEKVWVVYSENTHFQHSAAGNALISLCEETNEAVMSDLASHGQKVYSKQIGKDEINKELSDIMLNGFRAIRFMHKFGGIAGLALNNEQMKKQILFPENIALRAAMIAFFQDVRNGVDKKKTGAAQLAMFDALFKGSFLQPCLKLVTEDGKESVNLALAKKANCDDGIIELYTSPELVEKSQSHRRFKEQDPKGAGYRKIDFPKILEEIDNESLPVSGFCVDKDNFRFVFEGETLENLKKAYAAWTENGGSFVKK